MATVAWAIFSALMFISFILIILMQYKKKIVKKHNKDLFFLLTLVLFLFTLYSIMNLIIGWEFAILIKETSETLAYIIFIIYGINLLEGGKK